LMIDVVYWKVGGIVDVMERFDLALRRSFAGRKKLSLHNMSLITVYTGIMRQTYCASLVY
jgi:hypothetical protein